MTSTSVESCPRAGRSRPGDLWELGDHRLVCGDCTDRRTVERLMDGITADLMVTDPPYGIAYAGARTPRRPIRNDDLTGDAFRAFLAAAFQHAPLRSGAAFYVCAPSGPPQTEFRLALADAGLGLKQSLVWLKHHFVLSRSDYHAKHETILYGWKPGAPHYFVPDRSQHTVWEFKKPHRSPFHPTAKPVPLAARAVANSSRPGEVVYGGFGGGGAVLIACEETGRRCRMVEIDPEYCDAAVSRWENLTGRTASRHPASRSSARMRAA
jgi:DNA modification methylase